MKISEADGYSRTVAAAINLTYWLLAPSIHRFCQGLPSPFKGCCFPLQLFFHVSCRPTVNHTFSFGSWISCSHSGACSAQDVGRPDGGGTLSLPRPIFAVFSYKALRLGWEVALVVCCAFIGWSHIAVPSVTLGTLLS